MAIWHHLKSVCTEGYVWHCDTDKNPLFVFYIYTYILILTIVIILLEKKVIDVICK